MDFFKHLSPEARQRVESQRAAHIRDVTEMAEMDVETLCEKAEYYLKNSEFTHRYQPGEPVYDGAMAHVVIPELIRRLRKMASTVGTSPAEQTDKET